MNAATQDILAQERWVLFSLDAQRYALPLSAVLRIVRAAEITELPLAPGPVAGAIDIGGRILPVFPLRRRLRQPDRPLALSDQFIIARTSRRDLVLVVDATHGLVDAQPQALAHPGPLRGALSLPDGLVFIEDLESFLSPEEDEMLERALREAEVRVAR